ncbi:hypothetical protein [Streptomyces sp. NPDC005302]|uniref:hypothetical protein n=1 Tax=Streptomyces sp. NPDC005302 TaxID=3154675 RepID=UPI0033A954B3
MVKQQPSSSAVVIGCVVGLAALPAEAWLLMLVIGAVHSVALVVPAVGFGTAILFVIGINMLTAYSRKLFRRN